MKLLEIFNRPTPVTWVTDTDTEGKATWVVGDASYVFRALEQPLNDGTDRTCITVVFAAVGADGREEYENTGTGNEYIVYSTVFECIRTFLSRHGEPKPVRFSGEDDGRESLYKRFISKFLPNWTVDFLAWGLFTCYPPGWERGPK